MSAPTGADDSRRLQPGAGGLGILPLAGRRLTGEGADRLRILGDYARGLRAIADHPGMDASYKETRLAEVGAALDSNPSGGAGDAATRAALTLRHLLESLALALDEPRQMLQAAMLDTSKTVYPDWSDLLAWCQYWSAPMGRLGIRLAGGRERMEGQGESFATAAQLLYLIEQAPLHFRWLGRVYLPQRWFRDAGGSPEDLGAGVSSEELKAVFQRTAAEARRFLDRSSGMHRAFPGRSMRIAAATAQLEARAWARALTRCDPLSGPCRPARGSAMRIAGAGILRGLFP